MPWPLSQDYNEAIQNPTSCFADAELQQTEAKCNAIGIPMPRSGNFADVYEMAGPGGKKWAVKCFTRQVPGLRERYAAISAYLKQVNLPFMVDFSYLEQGVRVKGQWYPSLKMHWVEGFCLNQFVKEHADNPPVLELLAQIWLRLAQRLREAQMAHCDLQHGNVLLVPGSQARSLGVRLIDYDGMFVPALAQTKSGEVGHPAYQHPQRLREAIYSAEVDRFPHLVIYTALRSLMVGGRYLWNKFDNGDNLLFRQADLNDPGKSALFAELLKLNDAKLRSLVQILAQSVSKPLDQTPLVEELFDSRVKRKSVVVSPAAPPEATPGAIFAQAAAGDPIRRPRRSQRSYAGIVVAAGVTLVGLAVGAVILSTNRDSKPSAPVVAVAQPAPSTSTRVAPTRAEPKSDPEPKKTPEPMKEPAPRTDPTPKKPPEPKPDPEPKKPSEPKSDPEPKKGPEPRPKDPEPLPAPQDQRKPVPSADTQLKAEKVIKDLFKVDFAKRKPQERLALARTLLEEAARMKDDPGARFVFYRESRELAVLAGHSPQAMLSIDEMAKEFAINGVEMKAIVLDKISTVARTQDTLKSLAEIALAAVDGAVRADDFASAARMLKVADGAARKVKNAPLVTSVQTRRKAVDALHREFVKMTEAAKRLETKPDDPEANSVMGKYLCFHKGQWEKGLPLLGKGADQTLRDLVNKDQAKPVDAAEQVAVADGWWDLAGKEKGVTREHLLLRANFWYERAAPGLNGSTKGRVEKRIVEVETSQIRTMTPEDQVNAVIAKLKEHNPGFNGQEEHRIEGDLVTELKITTDNVTDVSPLRVLASLKKQRPA